MVDKLLLEAKPLQQLCSCGTHAVVPASLLTLKDRKHGVPVLNVTIFPTKQRRLGPFCFENNTKVGKKGNGIQSFVNREASCRHTKAGAIQ